MGRRGRRSDRARGATRRPERRVAGVSGRRRRARRSGSLPSARRRPGRGPRVPPGPSWPNELVMVDEDTARAELTALPSIGPKIADCIALFGLCHDAAVPVDTHVWGLARDLFGARFQGRTLTPTVYEEVRGAFRER